MIVTRLSHYNVTGPEKTMYTCPVGKIAKIKIVAIVSNYYSQTYYPAPFGSAIAIKVGGTIISFWNAPDHIKNDLDYLTVKVNITNSAASQGDLSFRKEVILTEGTSITSYTSQIVNTARFYTILEIMEEDV